MTTEEQIAALGAIRMQVRVDGPMSAKYYVIDRFEQEDDGSITVVVEEE